MSEPNRLTLTDEECTALCVSLPPHYGYRELAQAAAAFGERRGLQRAADALDKHHQAMGLDAGEPCPCCDREREGGGDAGK